jgi:NAD(P)-dependent dehydrogenase (short-subunit alcohol dehydrogenase family)
VAGRVVLVTGASSGIGRRLAEQVAAAGATAVVTARRTDELAELVEAIEATGGIAHAVVGDLSSEEGINEIAQTVLDRFGAQMFSSATQADPSCDLSRLLNTGSMTMSALCD